MNVRLEFYLNNMGEDEFAVVICNAVPRVGEFVCLTYDEKQNDRYLILEVTHILNETRFDRIQTVRVVVASQPD